MHKGHPHNTAKPKSNSSDSFAKTATDWIADQFAVTKAIKKKREAGDKAGKKAENK